MSVKVAGGDSNILANVNSDKELLISPNKDVSKAGHVLIGGEINRENEGIGRITRPIDISPDFRLRTGIDSTLFYDTFNHGQFNVSKYKGVDTTMTKSLGSGRLVLNSGNSVTSGQATQVQTWSFFKLILSSTLYVDFELSFAQLPQLNNVCEFGIGLASGVTAPLDGVLFRLNSAGAFLGITNINGSETSVVLDFTIVPTTMYHFLIVIHNDITEFWIDDICYGKIETPQNVGSPCMSMSLPLLMRVYNSGTVTTAQRMEITNVSITSGDQNINKLWPTIQAIQGNSSVRIPDGVASGQTVNYANSAAPASATLSNTAAGYTTLGGQFQFAAIAGAETDYALFAYQVPAATALVPGKNLIIRGIRIETFNMGAAVATTPTLLQWGVGFSSTAVSLATADSATTGTCAPRRLTLGVQSLPISSVIGYAATPIDINLDAPESVSAGQYVHIILKMPVATATASQIIRGTVFINGYFE